MTRTIVHNEPEDTCFGCGHRNDMGLRLVFVVGDDHQVEVEYVAPKHQEGAPGVVHGGIQATLLDEVMGMAVHADPDRDGLDIVTSEFKLEYRKPTPCNTRLRVRGRLLRSEGRNFFVEGEIVDDDGTILTRADSRWMSI